MNHKNSFKDIEVSVLSKIVSLRPFKKLDFVQFSLPAKFWIFN